MIKYFLTAILLVLGLLNVKAQCSCECCSKSNYKTFTTPIYYGNTLSSGSYITSGGSSTVTTRPSKPVWEEGFRLVEYITNDKQKKNDTVTRDFWKETDTTTLRTVRNKMDVIGFSTIEEGGKLAHYPVNQIDSLYEFVNYTISYRWKKSIIEVKGKLVKTIEPHLVETIKIRDKTPVKYFYRNKEVTPLEIFYQTKRKPLE